MASSSDPRLANRILRGLLVGIALGIAGLLIGPHITLPEFFQTAVTHIGIKNSPTLLEFLRGLSTVALEPFGKIFLRLLFFVVIPLVFASLCSGVLQLGTPSKLGPLALRTFTLFFLNMAIGVALGMAMMHFVDPGSFIDSETRDRLVHEYGGAAQKHITHSQSQVAVTFSSVIEMFMPANLLAAVVGSSTARIGDVLPLILFAILVGVAGTRLATQHQRKLQEGLEIINELMTGIVHLALRLAPYAVPCLIFGVIVKSGLDIIVALGVFVIGCASVMALHLFGTMSLWIKLWTQFSPLEFFATIKEALITAFSTSSSNATLPTALAATEKLKLSPTTARFVLPLGTTMNMSGTALYEGCVVLFVAQVFGVDLSFGQQITLLFLSVLSAVAVAGIPGGSLPLIAGLLMTFNVPADGIGIILGVDRVLDMCRTTTNVGCDIVTAAIVDAQQEKKS